MMDANLFEPKLKPTKDQRLFLFFHKRHVAEPGPLFVSADESASQETQNIVYSDRGTLPSFPITLASHSQL
jgi:hypothetical protein